MRGLATARVLLPLGLVCSLAGLASAAEFKKGPYLQSVTETSAYVCWESDSATVGKVVVQSPMAPDIVVEEQAPTKIHQVKISGLSPARRYTYRVASGGEEQGGEFGTAPKPGEAFSFVVFGDTRSQSSPHRNLVERVRKEVPDFILLTGDMVNEGTNHADWQQFFEIERELLKDNPLYPVIGNHDREPRPSRTAENYRKYFVVPDDTPDPERYYAFTYSNSRFLVLDSNLYSFALTDQTAWIERELMTAVQDPKLKHIFVVMHHPPFSTSIHGGHAELREMWTPLFEKYRVDAVFSGHDHTYEHCHNNGTEYIVSGGGGAPLYPKDPQASKVDKAACRYFERTFNFLRVQVTGDFVEVAAMRDDGTLIEAWSWGKMPEPVAKAPAVVPAAAVAAAPSVAATPALAATSVKAGGVKTAGVKAAGGGCAVGGDAGGGGAGAAGVLVALAALVTRRRRAR